MGTHGYPLNSLILKGVLQVAQCAEANLKIQCLRAYQLDVRLNFAIKERLSILVEYD